jgi:outer membrane protein assembly factor BamB
VNGEAEEGLEKFKYWAFISYSHMDRSWGDWLHGALENYRPPRGLIGKAGRDGVVQRKNLPVFRDREELPGAASLSDNINSALRKSRYLIVVCSPHAAVSRWVNEEIVYFKSLGREDRVLCFIVSGEPNATDKPASGQLECFPPGVRYRVGVDGRLSDQRVEPIAPDARPQGDGRKKAKLKLIAGLLGINYDDLYRRERRRALRRNLQRGVIAAILLGALVWWIAQKGEVRFALTPQPAPDGLRLSVDQRAIPFDPARPTLRLAAGTHSLQFEAPNYQTSDQSISVERRQKIERPVDLVHEKGTLDVEVYPEDAQIEVDGKPFGSRIQELEIDTGEHLVRATKPGHYERTQAITVEKGRRASAYLSLDRAQASWNIARWDVQGGFVNVGDVDGDGVEDFAHNFITEVAVISGASGKLIREFPTRDGNLRPFRGADLGGSVGKVVLSSGSGNSISAEGKRQTDVFCFRPDQDKPFWTWIGPAPRVDAAQMAIVGDQNGDGVSEIVIFSCDNNFYLVDGATGKTLQEGGFGISEWLPGPWVVRCPTAEGEGIVFCGMIAEANPNRTAREKTFHAGLVRLRDNQLAWQRDFPGMLAFYVTDVDNDGRPEIVFVSETDWLVCDGETGRTKFQGKLPRSELLGFWFADLDGDGTVEWIMGFRDNVQEPRPLVAAMRLKDGSMFWPEPRKDLRPDSQQMIQDERLIRTSDGGLLFRTEDALLSVDAISGRIRWRQPIAAGGTSGFISRATGKPELFLGEVGKGVRCIALDGRPRWGASFNREYNPMLLLADVNHRERTRLILNHHDGKEAAKCEIACVLAPEGGDWIRRVIPPNPPEGSPNGSAPRAIDGTTHALVAELTAAPPGEPNLWCYDAVSGVRVWNARELFQTVYRRYGDPVESAGESEATPAMGHWAGDAALGLLGHAPSSLTDQRTNLFVYRADNGKKLAVIPVEPRGEAYAASFLADVDGDGQSDFVVARPNIIEDTTGRNVSGDVVTVGGAQQKQLWRRELTKPYALAAMSLPNESSTRVLVTLRDGTIVALRGSDGEVLWESRETGADEAAAIVKLKDGQQEVVTVSPAGVVSILDPKSGVVRLGTTPNNVRSAHGPVTATTDGSTIFLACEAAGIVALDAETLREKWRSPSGETFSVPPLVVDLGGDGHFEIVACADSGNVVILDPESGALVSSEPLAQATSERSPPRGPLAFLPPAKDRPAKLLVTCADGVLRTKTLSSLHH